LVVVIQLSVASLTTQLGEARHSLNDRLDAEGIETDHIVAVAAVANELLGAAFEARPRQPLTLSVELFALLTSVRVRCPRGAQLRDEPFGIRERVLNAYAFAWGARGRPDGDVDLWAELARSSAYYR
jgi:hypothetical protein